MTAAAHTQPFSQPAHSYGCLGSKRLPEQTFGFGLRRFSKLFPIMALAALLLDVPQQVLPELLRTDAPASPGGLESPVQFGLASGLHPCAELPPSARLIPADAPLTQQSVD